MKFSIITATYNSAHCIGDCMASVAGQSHGDIERIIIDGSSRDDTLAIIKASGCKVDRLISEADRGIYDALNKGINLALGDVIGFVHSFVKLLMLTIYANLIQLPPNYARAAADLGASHWQTFRHVILPLTLPGIITGAFLTFVLCIGDYITPQILGGNNELTLPQIIMMQMGRQGNFPMAAALSMVLMATVALAYIACARWLRLDRI